MDFGMRGGAYVSKSVTIEERMGCDRGVVG